MSNINDFWAIPGCSIRASQVRPRQRVEKVDAKRDDGDGDVTIEEFKSAFGPNSLDERTNAQVLLSGELGMSKGDMYLFSRRFIDEHRLTRDFDPVNESDTCKTFCTFPP